MKPKITNHKIDPKVDPRRYWEARMETWDANRHGIDTKAMPFIYRITHNPPEAIEFRKHVAVEYLALHVQGKRVVELGCGTGRLSQQIIELGASSYHGYDFAENTINMAIGHIKGSGLEDKINFTRSGIDDLSSLEADIVLTNGLFSWLTNDQIDRVFAMSRGADFLHTITERRINLRQILKYLHEHAIGTHHYSVQFKTVNEIYDLAAKHGCESFYEFRNLYTVVYLSSLPFPENLGPQQMWESS